MRRQTSTLSLLREPSLTIAAASPLLQQASVPPVTIEAAGQRLASRPRFIVVHAARDPQLGPSKADSDPRRRTAADSSQAFQAAEWLSSEGSGRRRAARSIKLVTDTGAKRTALPTLER